MKKEIHHLPDLVFKRLFFSLISFLGVVLVLGGCVHFAPKQRPVEKFPVDTNSLNLKVLNQNLLNKKNARILIVPFTAGVGVGADQSLDRISLMIVRSMTISLEKSSSPLQVLSSEQANNADFVVQGHITYRGKSRQARRSFFRPAQSALGFSAKMLDKETGSLILVCSGEKSIPRGKSLEDTQMILAEELGQDIAEFIVYSADKKNENCGVLYSTGEESRFVIPLNISHRK